MMNKFRRLGKHRTCNRCKAMLLGSCGKQDRCELGYELDQRKGPFGISIGYPGEPCPKPITNKEWLDSPAKWEIPSKGGQK